MNEPIMESVCAVCNYRVNAIQHTDSSGNVAVTWLHGNAGADHDPVPAPGIPGLLIRLCDFCNAPDPTWRFRLKHKFAVEYRGDGKRLTELDDGKWATCDQCRVLVQRRDADGLHRRAMAGHDDPSLPVQQRSRLADHRAVLIQAFFLCEPSLPERIDPRGDLGA